MKRLVFLLIILGSCTKGTDSVDSLIGIYQINETWQESGSLKSRIYNLDVRKSEKPNHLLLLNISNYGHNTMAEIIVNKNNFEMPLQNIGGGFSVKGSGTFNEDNTISGTYNENTNTGDVFIITMSGTKK